MTVSTLPVLRGTQYQTVAFFASSTQETWPVMCTLLVALIERKDNCNWHSSDRGRVGGELVYQIQIDYRTQSKTAGLMQVLFVLLHYYLLCILCKSWFTDTWCFWFRNVKSRWTGLIYNNSITTFWTWNTFYIQLYCHIRRQWKHSVVQVGAHVVYLLENLTTLVYDTTRLGTACSMSLSNCNHRNLKCFTRIHCAWTVILIIKSSLDGCIFEEIIEVVL